MVKSSEKLTFLESTWTYFLEKKKDNKTHRCSHVENKDTPQTHLFLNIPLSAQLESVLGQISHSMYTLNCLTVLPQHQSTFLSSAPPPWGEELWIITAHMSLHA